MLSTNGIVISGGDGLGGGVGVLGAAEADIVAGATESFEAVVGDAALVGAVGECATFDDFALLGTAACSEQAAVGVEVIHPFPGVADHVVGAVGADAFRELSNFGEGGSGVHVGDAVLEFVAPGEVASVGAACCFFPFGAGG